MAKIVAKRNVGMEILEGLRQLKRGEVGRIVNVPSVNTIRERTGLSQAKFAALPGVSVRTLQEWEQGAARPRARLERCCWSQQRIRKPCSKSPSATHKTANLS